MWEDLSDAMYLLSRYSIWLVASASTTVAFSVYQKVKLKIIQIKIRVNKYFFRKRRVIFRRQEQPFQHFFHFYFSLHRIFLLICICIISVFFIFIIYIFFYIWQIYKYKYKCYTKINWKWINQQNGKNQNIK